jgi:hypothetical protein
MQEDGISKRDIVRFNPQAPPPLEPTYYRDLEQEYFGVRDEAYVVMSRECLFGERVCYLKRMAAPMEPGDGTPVRADILVPDIFLTEAYRASAQPALPCA